MSKNLLTSAALIILWLKLTQASSIAIADLNAQHSADTVRLAKANEILKYMNRSANPCDDFYEYACGNYAKYHPTDGESIVRVSFMELQAQSMDGIKQELLNTADAAAADTDADRKVKLFFRSCLNTPRLSYGDKLRAVIEEFGQMPVLVGKDKWQASDFDWAQTIAHIIRKTGSSNIFDISVGLDYHNRSLNRVQFGEPSFLLQTKSLYVDESITYPREIYRKAIATQLHQRLGVEEELAAVTAQEILDFEIALAQGMPSDTVPLNFTEIVSLEDIDTVQRQYLPHWDSKELIGEVMGFTPAEVYVEREYLNNALEVLANTPAYQVANYVFYTYLSNFMFRVREIEAQLVEFCYRITKEHFYKNLDNMVYRASITPQMQEGIRYMWQEIKTTLKMTLQSPRLHWMSAETRQQAVDKLNAMTLDILSYEGENFAEEFAQLDFNEHDYVGNVRSLLQLQGKKARDKMNQPPQMPDNGAASSFSPTYSLQKNAVNIPVSLLQPYYYWSSDYPQAYNYAMMGTLVGHELLHGFDSQGRKYDGLGNVHDWWDLQSDREFRNRTQCFVDQYKRYVFAGRPLGEMRSQTENIADNGGLRLAYASYMSWYDNADAETLDLESLPGVDSSPQQLFFLSFSQMWCSNIDATYATTMHTENHAPPKFRIIGTLSNFAEFSKAFNCPAGAAMNPESKCEIY